MQSLRAPERPVSHFRGRNPPQPERKVDLQLSAREADQAIDRMAEDRSESAVARAAQLLKRPVAALPGRVEPRVTRADADRRDPAPSRLSYRLERLWLTPYFRAFMRFGLPVLAVGGAVALYLGNEDRRAAITGTFADLRAQIENRPEFMVTLMSVDGASQPVADAVRGMVTVPLPASSFQLDLEAMRAAIEQVDAVESARLMVRSGGVLAVEITERRPAILWRTEASVEMLDATGHRVATLVDRAGRPDLPLMTGIGAEDHVPEALAILAAAQPILPRVRGLVRMGDRRWDMVLDRDQRIMLPETDPVQAVERAMAIDTAEEMLARDLAVVDLRNPDRPTLRLTTQAVAASKAITETVTKVAGE
jgi:cell division protein FtsQ